MKLVNELNTFLTMLERNRGLLSVFGAFLIMLCIGCYHGTFGNILPYLTSYMKQVMLRFNLHLSLFSLKPQLMLYSFDAVFCPL